MTDILNQLARALLASEAIEALDGAPLDTWRVDWTEFWNRDSTGEDWLARPLIARGRSHAIFAGAKSGKSLLVLDVVAALATGRSVLGAPPADPVDVLYLDYEMTLDDLHDRLEGFGYGPDDDLSHLHYISLPTIEGLDTKVGAEKVVASARAWGCQLVVIDTTARAVHGPENDSDTYRALYTQLGLALKAANIASARLDHSGKDAEKGQRGSSAKNDDVDVVWRITRADDGLTVTSTHRRMSWVPERFELTFTRDADDPSIITGHRLPPAAHQAWPPGTAEVADLLDGLGVPSMATGNQAFLALRDAGHGRRRKLVLAAQRFRRSDGHLGHVLTRGENVTAESTEMRVPPSGYHPSQQEPGTTPGTGEAIPAPSRPGTTSGTTGTTEVSQGVSVRGCSNTPAGTQADPEPEPFDVMKALFG